METALFFRTEGINHMSLETVYTQILVLFLATLTGYVANKAGILNADANRTISRMIINVTLPALILSSVSEKSDSISTGEVLFVIALAFGTYLVYGAIAFFIPKLLRVRECDAGLYRFMTIFGNTGFIGYPVITAIFGSGALFYAVIFNLPFNLLVFSVGVYLIAGKEKMPKVSWKLFVTPGIVASLLSIALFLLNLDLPQVIAKAATFIGQISTPAGMLIIGSTLALIPIREALSDARIYLLSAVRLILIPVLIWLILHPFITNQILLGTTVVVSAMPVATNTTILCNEYNGNMQLASKGVLVSTVAFIVTIPFIMKLLFL